MYLLTSLKILLIVRTSTCVFLTSDKTIEKIDAGCSAEIEISCNRTSGKVNIICALMEKQKASQVSA